MAANVPSALQMPATSLSFPIFTTGQVHFHVLPLCGGSGGSGSSPSPFRVSMAKGKNARTTITLECTDCVRSKSKGVSRYITEKNRQNTPNRIELKKFCPFCNKHTVHGEIKK